MLSVISKSETDSIIVYDYNEQPEGNSDQKLSKDNITVYFNIHGVTYFTNIKDFESFEN